MEKQTVSDDDLKNFCTVTGATIERAKFYVEAANGDLGLAIESFFENGGNDTEMEESAPSAASQMRDLNQDENDEEENSDEDPSYTPFTVSGAKAPKAGETRKTRNTGKIFSLNDMNDDDDEETEEKGQAFYAGGSSTSGQQILGPKKNPEKIIKDLFQKAKEHGAQEVDQSEAEGTSKKSTTNHGTGYRLGTGGEPSEVIPGAPVPKKPKVSILKLWKNGFNVSDGPLRSYEDEKNKEFLASIQRGELPRELINQAEGGEVHLDMQDHREEEFVPPKEAYKLYNEGYKLGSSSTPAPKIVSNASASDKATNEDTAKKNINLDLSKPITQIQIRLSDGSRIIIKTNLTQKISQLKEYLNTARPEYAGVPYTLMTSFPNKELTNFSETIEEAKLQNGTIIQKL